MPKKAVLGGGGNFWDTREDRNLHARQVVVTVKHVRECPQLIEERFLEAYLDRVSSEGPERVWEARILDTPDRFGFFLRAGTLAVDLSCLPLRVAYASYLYPEGALFQLFLEADLEGQEPFRIECPIDPATDDAAVVSALEKVFSVPVVPLTILDDELHPVMTRELRHGPDVAAAALKLWTQAVSHAGANTHAYDQALERFYRENPETRSPLLEPGPEAEPAPGAPVAKKTPTVAISLPGEKTATNVRVGSRPTRTVPPPGQQPEPPAAPDPARATPAKTRTGALRVSPAAQPETPAPKPAATRRPTLAMPAPGSGPEEIDRRLANLLTHYHLLEDREVDHCQALTVSEGKKGVTRRLAEVLAAQKKLAPEVAASLVAYITKRPAGHDEPLEGVALTREDLRVASLLVANRFVTADKIHAAIAAQWNGLHSGGQPGDLLAALLRTGAVDESDLEGFRDWLQKADQTADTTKLQHALARALGGAEQDTAARRKAAATEAATAVATPSPPVPPASSVRAKRNAPVEEQEAADSAAEESDGTLESTEGLEDSKDLEDPDSVDQLLEQAALAAAETEPAPAPAPRPATAPSKFAPPSAEQSSSAIAAARAQAVGRKLGGQGSGNTELVGDRTTRWTRLRPFAFAAFVVVPVVVAVAQLIVGRVAVGNLSQYLACRDHLMSLGQALTVYVQRYGSGLQYPGTTRPPGNFDGPGNGETPNGIFWAHLARLPNPQAAILHYPYAAEGFVCPALGSQPTSTSLDYSGPKLDAKWLPGMGTGPVFPGGRLSAALPPLTPIAGDILNTAGEPPHSRLPSGQSPPELCPVLFISGEVEGLTPGTPLHQQYLDSTQGSRSR
ncbi:MAG: hypothetical protein HYZ53_06240 [Planctomycetes bacterium]|nr:hypothetical protein [Planctomycetota bacterium]